MRAHNPWGVTKSAKGVRATSQRGGVEQSFKKVSLKANGMGHFRRQEHPMQRPGILGECTERVEEDLKYHFVCGRQYKGAQVQEACTSQVQEIHGWEVLDQWAAWSVVKTG